MQQQDIHDYLERYFIANDCQVIDKTDGHLHVQLSIDLDKRLMNRPFYWHYLEKTGGVPNPMQMQIITDEANAPEQQKGEKVHFGSPRLHQIFQSTKELGGFIRLYENIDRGSNQSIPLQPWLCLNVKVSYQCDRKKDVIYSLGLNLIHGQIVDGFFDQLVDRSLTPKIPDYCFTLSPLIKPKSGLLRLEKLIYNLIEQEDEKWAIEARERLAEDLNLLDRFYEENEEKPETYHREKEAIESQYKPKIKVNVINGGMFYLHQQVF
ncbi:YqhG family protein [Desertibacillus haloalkaliphilus]|uniref:YqhG family protein n=1 Tax=Desertibacillus haloalkaliphilus TaxID=1328930 RepID=UPI001C27771C|nr:YqhG family protein [Desertibacillus haloalkaliphilus]MBU8908992.1 YqhG family protein [Desertibacillus haloalkaliphilus]